MHNKSLTVDNPVTLIGRRNMSDAYFDATDGVAFANMDVLAVGPGWARCPPILIATGQPSPPTRLSACCQRPCTMHWLRWPSGRRDPWTARGHQTT